MRGARWLPPGERRTANGERRTLSRELFGILAVFLALLGGAGAFCWWNFASPLDVRRLWSPVRSPPVSSAAPLVDERCQTRVDLGSGKALTGTTFGHHFGGLVLGAVTPLERVFAAPMPSSSFTVFNPKPCCQSFELLDAENGMTHVKFRIKAPPIAGNVGYWCELRFREPPRPPVRLECRADIRVPLSVGPELSARPLELLPDSATTLATAVRTHWPTGATPPILSANSSSPSVACILSDRSESDFGARFRSAEQTLTLRVSAGAAPGENSAFVQLEWGGEKHSLPLRWTTLPWIRAEPPVALLQRGKTTELVLSSVDRKPFKIMNLKPPKGVSLRNEPLGRMDGPGDRVAIALSGKPERTPGGLPRLQVFTDRGELGIPVLAVP